MGVYGTTWLESAQPFLEKNLPIPAPFGTENDSDLASVLYSWICWYEQRAPNDFFPSPYGVDRVAFGFVSSFFCKAFYRCQMMFAWSESMEMMKWRSEAFWMWTVSTGCSEVATVHPSIHHVNGCRSPEQVFFEWSTKIPEFISTWCIFDETFLILWISNQWFQDDSFPFGAIGLFSGGKFAVSFRVCSWLAKRPTVNLGSKAGILASNFYSFAYSTLQNSTSYLGCDGFETPETTAEEMQNSCKFYLGLGTCDMGSRR